MLVILYHGGLPVPGDLGVTGFFVLSGFLITWLLLQEHERTGGVSLRKFYMRRSLRIFPAYFAFILLTLGADMAMGYGSDWGVGEVISALTYTVNYANAFTDHGHPTAHAWSLAIEEQFYLLWPAAFLLLLQRNDLRRGLIWAISAVLVWRTILYSGFGASQAYVYNALDTRFDSLAIGCLVAALCSSRRFLALASVIARRAWYPVPVVLAVYLSRVHLGEWWHYTIGFSMDSLLLAVLMLQLLQLSGTQAWRWLNYRFTMWVGVLSYPLYLWHIWGLGAADNILNGLGGYPLQLGLGIVLSFALASISYYGLERPFLRLKARFTTRHAQPDLSGHPAHPRVQTARAFPVGGVQSHDPGS